MPRYIDADKLLEELQEEIDFETSMYTEEQNKFFNCGLKCAYRDVEHQPTADVAPKSEVAREIKAFEDKVGKIYNHYVFEDTDYADDDVAIEAVINALTEVLNELAELKKKYTEGEE